jgi:SAM-dependent methyltransferase
MNINSKIVQKLISDYTNTEFLIKDNEFDTIYPGNINNLSDIYWTPVEVAIKAANLLVGSQKTRVLDIGSGAGKFCLIGAIITDGHFTGVEYRKSLVNLSTRIINHFNLENIKIIHSNIIDINFAEYDAFYFFNSFYENIIFDDDLKIDSSVELSLSLYKQYSDSLYKKLEELDSGKKLVTYCCSDRQIPKNFRLEYLDENNELKLWIKN